MHHLLPFLPYHYQLDIILNELKEYNIERIENIWTYCEKNLIMCVCEGLYIEISNIENSHELNRIICNCSSDEFIDDYYKIPLDLHP